MPIPYVEYGGTQMLQPPYVAEDISFYAFLLPADTAVLQKLLDDRLNIPSGGSERFEPAGPFVILAFNKLDKMYSMNPPDRDKGYFSEQECAVWVRIIDAKRQRTMWFLPYIFVDNSYAMVLGREVYGFPKAFGWLNIPEKPDQASEMSLESLILPTYSPSTHGERKLLISAKKTSNASDPLKIVATSAEFLAEALGALAPHEGLFGKLDLIIKSLEDLSQRKEPLVFLRQFPSSQVPGTACFQAITEMTANATAIRGACVVPGEWEIQITQAASHPIVAELGLSGSVIKSPLALWIGFDMNVNLGQDLWVASPAPKKEKIAILGGGVGAMSTALELTSAPDWQSRYDITIYQMGWRLGGKGASGRSHCNRIEEHGLHIWLGFYENAFRVMRQVYEQNKVNRPLGSPLREWNEAFEPENFVAIMDQTKSESGMQWHTWPIDVPATPGSPGDGTALTLWDTCLQLIRWLRSIYFDSEFHQQGDHPAGHRGTLAEVQSIFSELLPKLQFFTELTLLAHLDVALHIAEALGPLAHKHLPEMHDGMAKLLVKFRDSVKALMRDDLNNLKTRRLFQILDLGVSIASGLLRGGYLINPAMLNTLEDELQDWLKAQGADPMTYNVADSAILQALYDLVFAYEEGDDNKPSFEAGPALRSMLLMVGAYKGAIFWKMQAGMGDVVFGPMYQVLKDRGVKFEFFHRVESLQLTPDGNAVDSIKISVQATLKNKSQDYDPFVTCSGLPAWPADPCYDQLVEGEELKKSAFNLESFWTTWKSPAEKTLRAVADFDRVVLGISLGALPYLFDNHPALPEAFQRMLSNVKTVRTQAMQLWVNQPLDALGWPYGSVVLDAFSTPINTWAVMDQLLCREDWPEEVKGIHYFCGQMPGGIPDRSETDTPERALKDAEETCDDFIRKDLPVLWPKMDNPDFKIVSRFTRCNVDPTERYVQSVAHSTKFRLRADQSGLTNVFLAGDWTENGFNAGCVEAAVMSGIQAANAIAGKPINQGIDGPLASQLQVAGAPGS